MMEHAYASVNSRYLAPSKTQEPGHTVRGLPTPSRLFFRGKMLLVSCSQNAFLSKKERPSNCYAHCMSILPLEAMSVPYYPALHVSTSALIIIMEVYATVR